MTSTPTSNKGARPHVTPSTIIPPEYRGRWFRFFFNPTIFHFTRTVGSVAIVTYFLTFAKFDEGTVISDMRHWARARLNSFLTVNEDERRLMRQQKQHELDKSRQEEEGGQSKRE